MNLQRKRRAEAVLVGDPNPEAVAEPPAGDFSAALMMIATLPLINVKKADAVPRLLMNAEQNPQTSRE